MAFLEKSENLIQKLTEVSLSLYDLLELYLGGFPGSSVVKNLPVMEEIQALSLGWEDPLEKGMATHSSTLAWRIPWTVEPGGLLTIGSQRISHD